MYAEVRLASLGLAHAAISAGDNAVQLALVCSTSGVAAGPGGFGLPEARRLAIRQGYVLEGVASDACDAKRADLSALFEHYHVNCLSALRRRLGHAAPAQAAAGTQHKQQATQQPGTAASPADGDYKGPLQDGLRHGVGVLKYQIGKSTACYEGQFVRGVREGLGIITAADGARYEGSFKDNLMWGPGVFHFAPPHSPPQAGDGSPPQRVVFQGMFNGRPRGRGVLHWSDGSQIRGTADGVKMTAAATPSKEAACDAAAAAGRECAEAARDMQQQLRCGN